MNRRKFIQDVAAGTLGVSLGMLPKGLLAVDDLITVSILHTNDIHCHIEPFPVSNKKYSGKGGLARISGFAKKQKEENPNTLLLDAGDMFQGTPYFNYFKGELIMKAMSAAGYDAGTIGNHEFDNGLEGILNPLPNAKFPLISSNYDFSGTILAGKFPRCKTFNFNGVKVGVYALGIELRGLVDRKNYGNTIYNDPLKVALEMEDLLKNGQGCNLVVCLSHLGLKYEGDKVSDMVLAKETLFTDLIIGGHTHTYLSEPVIEKNKAGNDIIVNQAWWGGLAIGKIDFVFGRSRKNKKATFTNNKTT